VVLGERDREWRPAAARALLGLLFLLLSGQLFYLQILNGEHYLGLADNNRVRPSLIRAPRGIIYDRYGKVIARDRAASMIVLDPTYGSDSLNVTRLAALLDIQPEDIWEKVRWAKENDSPAVLDHDASFETVSKVEEHRDILKGVTRRLGLRRRYIPNHAVAHLVGYVAEVSETELAGEYPYVRGDLIGRAGLEKQYEEILRGKNGLEFIQVDAVGRELGPLPERSAIDAIPGRDLTISIDLELQKLAWNLLSEKQAGAVVALDPRRGDVLALVSYPTFDPNLLVGGVPHSLWAELNADTLFPLLNRPIQCVYPPGSIFKIAVASAGLEEGVISEIKPKVMCSGAFRYGNRVHRCWNRAGHGSVNLRRAIVESCDIYFYQLGLELGLQRMHDWAHKLGFDERAGIDLAHEKSGLYPDAAWYNQHYGRYGWSTGVNVNLSIGQGEVLTTPLQLARFVGAVGYDGMMFTPHIGLEFYDRTEQRGATLWEPRGFRLPLSQHTIGILQEAMIGVTEDEHGTGKHACIDGVHVAGKTGTAQNPHGEDHAWFAAYAPAEEPIIAVCVLVERGGHGGSVAAPIAGEVMRLWLEKHGLAAPIPPVEETTPDA